MGHTARRHGRRREDGTELNVIRQGPGMFQCNKNTQRDTHTHTQPPPTHAPTQTHTHTNTHTRTPACTPLLCRPHRGSVKDDPKVAFLH